ncbi:hypothetical protein Tco_1144332 [Tanacetum coccineum]
MLEKQNDLISKEKKVNTTPINYVKLNKLSEDFGKPFVSQKELSTEQDFWLQTSHPNTDQSASSPVKIEALKELLKVSQVNTSLKKLKYPLGQFDTVVKKRITPDAITKGEWGFEYTKAEHIKSMRENNKEEKVKQEMDEIKTINIELEHSVAKLLYENERLQKEIEHLKKIYKDQFDSIKKTRALSKEHCDSLIAQLNSKSMENADFKGQIQEKELLVYVSYACPSFTKPSEILVAVTPMNKVKKVRFSKPLTSSRNIHKIVESSKTPDSNTPVLPSTGLKSSTSASRSQRTCNKKNDRISQTPSSNMKNKVEVQLRRANLMVLMQGPKFSQTMRYWVLVTPNEQSQEVRFSKPLTSSRNIYKIVELSKTPDSNTPVLPSTGLKSSTSASRSQRTCNKKNDRISQTPSSNIKNKVEVQRKRVNLSSNKKNHVKDPIYDANVKHTMLNANSELICDKCKQFMFDANRDLCFLDFMKDVNVRFKSNRLSKANNIIFGNLRIAKIMGYGDYQLGNVTISRVYYIEGLGHNLFSVGQFCDSDLEVAF